METNMKLGKSSLKNTKPPSDATPKCPKCGKSLTTISYTEYGTKNWTGEGWQEKETGDAEWHTGCCDTELNSDELEEMGVF
jgi:hypothetical protein